MIQTLPLFRPLNEKLIALLKGLSKNDWDKKTLARNWAVKEVAAHLLDGNIRFISSNRDQLELKPDVYINGYRDLVNYLNPVKRRLGESNEACKFWSFSDMAGKDS